MSRNLKKTTSQNYNSRFQKQLDMLKTYQYLNSTVEINYTDPWDCSIEEKDYWHIKKELWP